MKIPHAVDETAIGAYYKAAVRSPRWACRDESTRGTASSSRRRCWAAPIWRRHGDRRQGRRRCPASSWGRFIDVVASAGVTMRLRRHLEDDEVDRTGMHRGSVAEIGKERDSRGCSTIDHTRTMLRSALDPTRSDARARLIVTIVSPATRCETGVRTRVRRRALGARVLAARTAMSHMCQNHVTDSRVIKLDFFCSST